MAHVLTLTIPTTAVAASHIDFPVLFSPESDAVNADYSDFWANVSASGGDLRFYETGGTATEFPREVVDLDKTAKTGEIWFKRDVSILSDSVTDIHADGTSSDYAEGAMYGRNAVWADYAAVFHFKSLVDSSGKSSDITLSNGASLSSGSLITDGVNDFAVSTLGSPILGSVLITSRARVDTIDDNNKRIFGAVDWSSHSSRALISSKSSGDLRYNPNDGSTNVTVDILDGGATTVDDLWIAATESGSSRSLYLNGNAEISTESTSINIASAAWDSAVFGGWAYLSGPAPLQFFDGSQSESRIRLGIPTNADEWITDEYANQSDPSNWYTVTAASGGATVTSWRTSRQTH